jgi:phage shock protein A
MGLVSRFRLLGQVGVRAAIDRFEDPPAVLDYAYEKQQELLVTVRRGLIDVATSRHLLLRQLQAIRERAPRLEGLAARALAHGREDLARQLLERKHRALAEVQGIEQHLAEVSAEEERLAAAQKRLAGRVEEFRAHRDATSARYRAARTQVAVVEALAGVSGELAEVGLAVGRAEDRANRMVARASALHGFLDHRGFGSHRLGSEEVESELGDLEVARALEEDLSALKTGEALES